MNKKIVKNGGFECVERVWLNMHRDKQILEKTSWQKRSVTPNIKAHSESFISSVNACTASGMAHCGGDFSE